MGALLPPVDTKATQRAAFTTGRVIVTRWGGGLGESLMGATIFVVSWIWSTPKPNHPSCVMCTVNLKCHCENQNPRLYCNSQMQDGCNMSLAASQTCNQAWQWGLQVAPKSKPCNDYMYMWQIYLSTALTSKRGWSGKREQVCPSGPIPRSNKSNTGKWSSGKACVWK